MSENIDSETASTTNSSSLLQSSILNTAVKSNMLRPSLFGTQLTTSSADELKVNLVKDSEELGNEAGSEKKNDENKTEEKTNPVNLLGKNSLPKLNLFTVNTSTPLTENSGFVFGQNVHERVTGESQSTSTCANSNNTENENSNASTSSTSNLLFSSAIQTTNTDLNETPKDTESKSLTQVAREYEESRTQKRKYEEVETFTGEENEINIVDLNCKLFAFVNCNWEERGRGSLRLNDSKDETCSSRVVFRTSGNLRLLLNTKIWSGMVAERPSQKSLRLTAIDNTGQIKIFLAMSRPDDINALFKALTQRIESHKTASTSVGDSKTNGFEEKKCVNENENGNNDSSEPSPKKVAADTKDQ